MSSLVFLFIALVLSVAGTLVLWLRTRKPSSMEAGIEEFNRGMRALAPQQGPSPRTTARPRRPDGAGGGPPG